MLNRCSCGVLVDVSILDKHVCDGARAAYEALRSERDALVEALGPAYVFLTRFISVEDALIDGFNIEAWADEVEALGVTGE